MKQLFSLLVALAGLTFCQSGPTERTNVADLGPLPRVTKLQTGCGMEIQCLVREGWTIGDGTDLPSITAMDSKTGRIISTIIYRDWTKVMKDAPWRVKLAKWADGNTFLSAYGDWEFSNPGDVELRVADGVREFRVNGKLVHSVPASDFATIDTMVVGVVGCNPVLRTGAYGEMRP